MSALEGINLKDPSGFTVALVGSPSPGCGGLPTYQRLRFEAQP